MKKTALSIIHKLKNKRILFVLLILISLLGLFIFFRTKSQPELTTARADIGNLQQTLVLSGEINAREKANLAFNISGKISYLKAVRGELIKKNQLIASLDQASALKSAQSSLLDYSLQRNTFEQTKDDNGVDKPSDAPNDEVRRILENNQFNLDKAVASYELKNLAIRDSNLYSPIEGYLTDIKDVHVGSNVVAGSPLFEIINTNTFYLAVLADQTEVVDLEIGQTCTITLDAYENKSLTGTISRISYTPKNGESGTVYEVEVNVDGNNLDSDLRLGMTGDAEFVVKEKKNVLFVPSKFVKTDDKGTYVTINKNKDKKYIKIGIETDENTEIISGLVKNDIVYD